MKINLHFKSNIYLLDENEGEFSQKFISKVTDANTLNYIKKKLHCGQNMQFPFDWQNKIANQGISCAYARDIGDNFTHGIITENGEPTFVCKCQHAECQHFSECSSLPDFRQMKVRSQKIIGFTKGEDENIFGEAEYYGDVKIPVVVKIPKISKSNQNVESRNNDSYNHYVDEWFVRGHWRTLSDGSRIWVKGHKRGTHHGVVVTNIINSNEDETNPIIIREPRPKYTDWQFEDGINNNGYVMKNLTKVDSADIIINSDFDERVFVNGAAGTGKTHAVIERLKHLINKGDINADEILVLCFSRAAVKVIRDRLKNAIIEGLVDESATDIDVRTFDSFATWYLKESVENINLQYSGYDDRIVRFISRFKTNYKELTDGLSYLIVDETQDLVGARAEMVQLMLAKIECGFMILGDQCQAIYDYQVKDEKQLNATRFFKWVDGYFGTRLKRYELTKNYRQQTRLQAEIAPLRKAMLQDGISLQKKELSRIIDKYRIGVDFSVNDILECSVGSRAILSWSNGDAYKQSQDLFTRTNPVDHFLQNNSRRNTLRKELAIILDGSIKDVVSKALFFQNAKERNVNLELSEELWSALQILDDRQTGYIKLSNIRQELLWESKDIKDILLSPLEHSITVSTIHKSKGKEYDDVLVNLSKLSAKYKSADSDEIKVYYVALTRAKNDITIKEIEPEYAEKSVATGRILKIGNRANAKVLRYELGLDGDIDPYGFVSKNLFKTSDLVRKNQEYIRENVKRGDELNVWRVDDVYKIYHNGNVIGRMNKSAFETYKKHHFSGKYYTHYMTNYNRFDKIYVSDIITIANKGLREELGEPYATSGFWLGVDFCGYSRPREE